MLLSLFGGYQTYTYKENCHFASVCDFVFLFYAMPNIGIVKNSLENDTASHRKKKTENENFVEDIGCVAHIHKWLVQYAYTDDYFFLLLLLLYFCSVFEDVIEFGNLCLYTYIRTALIKNLRGHEEF